MALPQKEFRPPTLQFGVDHLSRAVDVYLRTCYGMTAEAVEVDAEAGTVTCHGIARAADDAPGVVTRHHLASSPEESP